MFVNLSACFSLSYARSNCCTVEELMTSIVRLFQSLTILCVKNALRMLRLHLFLNNLHLCPLVLFCFTSKSKDGSVSMKPFNSLNVKTISLRFLLYSSDGKSNACSLLPYDSSLIVFTNFMVRRCKLSSILTCLIRLGLHIVPAVSSNGRTKLLYNVKNTSLLMNLIVRFIDARILFAFFTHSATCLSNFSLLAYNNTKVCYISGY